MNMVLTWSIASLCISPVHAGIMLLRRANSSFILDLLLLSIRLCAVFLAIFLPAGVCFFLAPPVVAVGVADDAFVVVDSWPVPVVESLEFGASGGAATTSRGFIWMILRDLVGGGGSAKSFFDGPATVAARLRDLTVSLGCIECLFSGVCGGVPEALDGMIAGGGSSNSI